MTQEQTSTIILPLNLHVKSEATVTDLHTVNVMTITNYEQFIPGGPQPSVVVFCLYVQH